MASPSRTAEREEERRHNLRTLAAASAGSATAALLTSQLWIAGTWIAAALTPVIVALVSEMVNRPADRIARTLTSDRDALPEAGGAAPPAPPEADPLPTRAPAEPGSGGGPTEAPMRVYRAGDAKPIGTRPGAGRPAVRRRRIAFGAVFGTAALAFVIAVAVITVPELLAGGSVGKNAGGSTFFGGDRERDRQTPQDTTRDESPRPEEDEQQQQQQTTPEEEQQTTPTEQPTEEQPAPLEETAPPGEPLPEQTPPTQQP